MRTPTAVVIATTNRAKAEEVRAILSGLPVRLSTLGELGAPLPAPIEDADTFEGNAIRRALHYAQLIGCWALADDSGLEVDALDGAPGVHSARYAGPEADAAANNAKLVTALAEVPPAKRSARFRCAVVLASPSEVLATASGVLEGLIVDDARGSNGFGYDPHFFLTDLGMTTAQISSQEKNRISHRGQALRAIRPRIEELLAGRC
jgi:XTP/dITP diphosphohydrolase